MDDDVEPERYYEWILWKLRKEKNMKFDERISLRQENAELRQKIKMLKEEIATMNKEKYGLLNRIKELNDIRDSVIR
jgi:cell division protein FtsB|tara:strand:+ start:733 stop:963 length:231 start_codon:yes stop_codon:yes gene_type:complete